MYQGDFLESFSLPDSDLFEDWLRQEQTALKRLAINGLWRLISFYDEHRDYAAGVTQTKRLLTLDPFNEEAHLQLMRMLARSDNLEAALAHYRGYHQLAIQEFDAPPSDDLKRAYEHLMAGEPVAAAETIAFATSALGSEPAKSALSTQAVDVRPLSQPPLPVPLTPLIGRADLTTALYQDLVKPENRLITVAGFGGTGKTHFALTLAQQAQHDFADGVCYIPLIAKDSPASPTEAAPPAAHTLPHPVDHFYYTEATADGYLTMKIAAALNVPLAVDVSPLQQLKAYLAQREMLLLFDNFEHYLASSQILTELLHAAPEITLLVISRERLRLYGEYVVAMPPLLYPNQYVEPLQNSPESSAPGAVNTVATQPDIAGLASVQLFLDRARRVCPSITPNETDWQQIANICYLLGGVPLAITLAASWVNHFTLAEIIREIQHNAQFLNDPTNDLGKRHKRMDLVLEETWVMLTLEEQLLLTQLTLFEGAFSRDAILTSTEAPLSALIALVDRGLVQTLSAGWYTVPPIIKRYAAMHCGQTKGRRLNFASQLSQPQFAQPSS